MENRNDDQNDGILLNQDIIDAIFTRHLLAYIIASTGKARIVEPHAYGVTHAGDHVLISWRWEAKEKGPTEAGEWELVRLDEMRDVRYLPEKFEEPRPGYTRDDRRLRRIIARL